MTWRRASTITAKTTDIMKEIEVTTTTENDAALGFPAPSSLLTLTLFQLNSTRHLIKVNLSTIWVYSKYWKNKKENTKMTNLAAALNPTETMNNNPDTAILHSSPY